MVKAKLQCNLAALALAAVWTVGLPQASPAADPTAPVAADTATAAPETEPASTTPTEPAQAPVPESEGPKVLTPTVQDAPAVNTVAPLPELREEKQATAP